MRFIKNRFWESNIPIRINSFIPRKSKNVIQEWNLFRIVIFRFWIESIDLLLNDFSNWFWHWNNLLKLFIEVFFFRLLVFTDYFLKSTFNDMFLWSFFEFFSWWSNDHYFHLDELIKLLEEVDNFLSSKNRIGHFKKFFLFCDEFLLVWYKAKSIENFEIISSHSKCVLI